MVFLYINRSLYLIIIINFLIIYTSGKAKMVEMLSEIDKVSVSSRSWGKGIRGAGEATAAEKNTNGSWAQ